MRKRFRASVYFLAAASLGLVAAPPAWGKSHKLTVGPDDPTYQVYQLLDDSYGGRLKDFYLLADIYTDPQKPETQLQHVLRVDYDKSRFFGRFQIFVRSVHKLTPDQLKTYSTEQIYDFGVQDEEEFEKIDPGPFGQKGDLFLQATSSGPLASAPTTDQVREQYNFFLTQYVLPALKK
jgi:hypothetical protein